MENDDAFDKETNNNSLLHRSKANRTDTPLHTSIVDEMCDSVKPRKLEDTRKRLVKNNKQMMPISVAQKSQDHAKKSSYRSQMRPSRSPLQRIQADQKPLTSHNYIYTSAMRTLVK